MAPGQWTSSLGRPPLWAPAGCSRDNKGAGPSQRSFSGREKQKLTLTGSWWSTLLHAFSQSLPLNSSMTTLSLVPSSRQGLSRACKSSGHHLSYGRRALCVLNVYVYAITLSAPFRSLKQEAGTTKCLLRFFLQMLQVQSKIAKSAEAQTSKRTAPSGSLLGVSPGSTPIPPPPGGPCAIVLTPWSAGSNLKTEVSAWQPLSDSCPRILRSAPQCPYDSPPPRPQKGKGSKLCEECIVWGRGSSPQPSLATGANNPWLKNHTAP